MKKIINSIRKFLLWEQNFTETILVQVSEHPKGNDIPHSILNIIFQDIRFLNVSYLFLCFILSTYFKGMITNREI